MGWAEPVRVLLADDQRLFREALRVLLELEPDIAVVAEARTGREAAELALDHDADVVLLDIEMPDGRGLEAAKALRERGACARCLIVTTFGRPGYLQRALDSGVAGFVVKDASTGALAQVIRRCARGQRVIDPGLAAAARQTGASPLTPREREVLRATTSGASVGRLRAPCTCRRGRCGTGSRPRSTSSAPATVPTRSESPREGMAVNAGTATDR